MNLFRFRDIAWSGTLLICLLAFTTFGALSKRASGELEGSLQKPRVFDA